MITNSHGRMHQHSDCAQTDRLTLTSRLKSWYILLRFKTLGNSECDGTKEKKKQKARKMRRQEKEEYQLITEK